MELLAGDAGPLVAALRDGAGDPGVGRCTEPLVGDAELGDADGRAI